MSYPEDARSASVLRRGRVRLSKRQQFLLFVKILVRYLQEHHPYMTDDVKAIVRECTLANRKGVQGYVPLMQVVGTRLQLYLGDEQWQHVNKCYQVYCMRNNVQIMVHRA